MGHSRYARSLERTAAGFASIAIVALLSSSGIAADFPNVIGTWMIAHKGRPVTSYQAAELASLSVKIAQQDGESFSGTIVGLKGKTERIVGAFRRDGSTFVYSSEKTAGTGRVQGNEMEICRTDAGCAVLVRSK
jgi:hypothetical protein